jgi:enoyl-CoA hydratase/carnithine racemase
MNLNEAEKSFETMIYEKENGIAYVTINRADVLNIYNVRMRDDLYQILTAIDEDREIKVVIFKGAGEKAFCAGADLNEFLTAPSPVRARQVRFERDVWGLFTNIRQPIIAALQGYVLGSGIEIALCCDIRIAAEDVLFGLPEVSLGIIPAAGGTQTVPRTIGVVGALDMLLKNRWLYADEALQYGLVNKVVPKDKLLVDVEQMAQMIASYKTNALQHAKQALKRGTELSLDQGLELELRLAALAACPK